MAEHDELFGNTYRAQMEANMPVTTIPGGHRLSDEALPVIKEVLMPKMGNMDLQHTNYKET